SIKRGEPVIHARLKVCWISAVAILLTAAVPFMPTDELAAGAMSFSFLWTLALSVNVYPLPVDLWGPGRAGLGVAALTAAFGFMQAIVSPVIGFLVDRVGFGPVCVVFSVLPLAGVAILQRH